MLDSELPYCAMLTAIHAAVPSDRDGRSEDQEKCTNAYRHVEISGHATALVGNIHHYYQGVDPMSQDLVHGEYSLGEAEATDYICWWKDKEKMSTDRT